MPVWPESVRVCGGGGHADRTVQGCEECRDDRGYAGCGSCDSLMSILRSDEMNALIEHERESLGNNFSAWLSAMEMNGASVSVSDLEAYVELARRRIICPRSGTAVSRHCVH